MHVSFLLVLRDFTETKTQQGSIKCMRDENKELRQKLALLQRTSAKEEVNIHMQMVVIIEANI